MTLQKKDAENRILERFVSCKSLGKIITAIEPSETPDFILKTFEGKISVELTNVMNPRLKQREAAQKRIIDDALTAFKKSRNDILKVYVDFTSEPLSYDNQFLNALSDELFQFVIGICEKNEGLEFRISTRNWPQFHKYFKSISVSNSLNFENWQPFGAYRVPYVEESWFRSRIEDKEQKIAHYSEDFDENWLLLNCDFGHKSSAFRFEQLEHDYANSEFDRIFIYQYFSNTVTILK